MCFVLDSNSFHCLFSPEHTAFLPFREWLYDRNRRTSLVIGGTKYREEVSRLHKYFGVLMELEKIRKISNINDDLVDKEKSLVASLETHTDFDDSHIISLFRVSGCRIFASHDRRADQLLLW